VGCLHFSGPRSHLPLTESVSVRSSGAGASSRVLSYALVFILTVAIFLGSPRAILGDSKYSLLLSESLLTRHTADLSHYRIWGLQIYALPAHPDFVRAPRFYELINDHGRLLYYYPHGSSLLSMPLVAILLASGHSVVRPDGIYDEASEAAEQHLLAALLMAALAVVFVRTAEVMLPAPWAVAVALGAALGTQVWSTASRLLWSHTWEIALLGMVVLELLDAEERGRRLRAAWLATLASWLFFVRPTGAIVAAALAIYIFAYHRASFFAYAATGLGWLEAFVAYSLLVFGEALPGYYQEPTFFSARHFLSALFGDLISPSRGLLVFVPVLLFVAYLLIRYWPTLPHRRLAVLAISVITVHQMVLTGNVKWWGGYSYGPRLSTDLVPWFVLLAVLGLRAFLDESGGRVAMPRAARAAFDLRNRSALVAGALLLALSVFINARGALSPDTFYWNAWVDIDHHPENAWDWRSPQFLAGLVTPQLAPPRLGPPPRSLR
jgi:hypothetical protein